MRKYGLALFVLLVFTVGAHAQTAPTLKANGTLHSINLGCTPGTAVAGVTVAGFNFYRATTSGAEVGTSALNGTTPVSTCAYNDTTATPGVLYYYVADEQSTTGNQSKPSNEVSATEPQNPNPPTLSITSVALNIIGTQETLTASFVDASTAKDFWFIYDNSQILARGNKIGGGTVTWKGNKQPELFFAVCDNTGSCAVQK
jgi:hypothetical protein